MRIWGESERRPADTLRFKSFLGAAVFFLQPGEKQPPGGLPSEGFSLYNACRNLEQGFFV